MPNFLPQTEWIKNDPTWKGAAPAPGLIDRRVEITGPVDRKMVINALNSGATQFMADFEGIYFFISKKSSTIIDIGFRFNCSVLEQLFEWAGQYEGCCE